ncbi:MAG: galactokinase [Vicinamibacteraceae bacterium]
MADRAVDEAFVRAFGAPPDAEGSAPARVNLIGEHTDYHEGYVLPTVLPQRTHIWLRRGERGAVRAYSATLSGDAAAYRLGAEEPGHGWIDYVQGVTRILRDHGIEVEGFDAWIASTIPVGGGVSSSAALCVALLRGLRTLQGLALDDHAIARLAQRVETEFVGAPVGIMDQMACSLGRPGEALFIDTRAIAFERIPWPADAELIVIDSGVAHQHAGGGYVDRRRESFAAAAALGVSHLRDVGVEALPAIARLPDVQARRARHIVTENQRVLDAVAALRADDLPAVGRLFAASHASMRDDYEITTPEIDALAAIGQADPAVHGARMTGGGFGGAVVMLARAGEGRAAAERIGRAYDAQVGRRATILSPLTPVGP